MQLTCRLHPPSLGSFSMIADFRPYCPDRTSGESEFKQAIRATNADEERGLRYIDPRYIETMTNETAFEMAVSGIRFGAGVTRAAGMDLADWGVRNVLVV